jgi:Fe-S-cluster containining protein
MQYITVPVLGPGGKEARMLAHKPNGDCIYLGDGYCTIHDMAPAVCKAFDCRKWLLAGIMAKLL